jgi:gliding motility-associated-like protein
LYSITAPGLYTLQVSNSCGLYQDSILVQTGNCVLALPNAFTPNGDGKNDVFRVIQIFPVSRFSMVIFNRWGQEVFATSNISKGWDGSFRGAPQPDGAYVWIVDLTDSHGVRQTQKGTVVLIR